MQGLASDHMYQYDDNNIQDTLISHLNNYEEIQKIVNHNHSLPLDGVKFFYSTGLFIHMVGGIAECVRSKSQQTVLNTILSSCLQSFCSCTTNNFSIHEDNVRLNNFNAEISALKADLDFTSPTSMW